MKLFKFLKVSLIIFLSTFLFLIFSLFGLAIWDKNYLSFKNNPWLYKSQIFNDNVTKNKSVILIHGFGGSPYDFKPLAERLSKEGFRVVIPTVPNQNYKTWVYRRGDFSETDYIEWLNNLILEEKDIMNSNPILIGFSMGGTLSTAVAEINYDLEKLILIAPFYKLATANTLSFFASKFIPWVPKLNKGNIYDKFGYKEYFPGTFLTSFSAYKVLARLAEMAKSEINKISIPTLIIASPYDKVADFKTINELWKDKNNSQIITLEKSNHILLYDYERDLVMDKIINFCGDLK